MIQGGSIAPSALSASRPSTSSMNLHETDEVLQEHYLRVQQTLLGAVDRQVREIETKMVEKENILKKVEDEKKDLGVELYRANGEIGRLNSTVAVVKSSMMQLQDEKQTIALDCEATEKHLKAERENKQLIEHELDRMRKELESSTLKINQLKEINAAYHSDIKIQKRIMSKMKGESEEIFNRHKSLEEKYMELKKLQDEMLQEKATFEATLGAQKQETKIAQNSIDKMNQEINQLTRSKKQIEKKWEEALSAMAKRDQSFQTVEATKQMIGEKLLDKENENRVKSIEKDEAEKRLREKELALVAMESQNESLRQQILTLETKLREAKHSLNESQIAESLYRQELDQANLHHGLAVDELERKISSVSELKAKIEDMKTDFETRFRDSLQMNLARKEEQMESKAEVKIKQITSEEESKNLTFRRQNAELNLLLKKKDEDLTESETQARMWSEKFKLINSSYIKLYEEAKHLVYELERKEHDVNFLKSKLQESCDVDATQPFRVALQQVQKELTNAKAENDRIQKMWLDSQKDNLKHKEKYATLENETVYLATQLGVTDTIKLKGFQELEEAKREAMEQKLEAAKLYNELKRTQPLIDGLKKKNMEMEKQIEELRLDKQEDRIKQSTATMMLKTEIRRLYADRRLVDQGRIQDERALNVVERKQALTKDMVTQLKEELLAMKKENFELKVLAEKMKKRYHEAQAQARKLAEVAGRNVGDLATKIGNTIPPKVGTLGNKPPAWASLASTPGGPSQHARIPPPSLRATKSTLIEPELPKPELDDVPDFEAWRLKIDTLTTERDFLSNECCMLKTRGNELSTKIAILERASNEAQARIKALELDQKTQTSSYKTMQLKCNKASKIAASIEKQFKDAKPNAKIDYSLLVESEPSTQLLAALLSAPTEQMRASSTNPDNAFRR